MKLQTSISALFWMHFLALCLVTGGCSTVTSSDIYNKDLQDTIRNDHAITPGDYVIIHTQDNLKYEFVVETIDEEQVSGQGNSISIDDIAALKIKTFSVEKTVGVVGGASVGLYLLYFAVLLAGAGILF